MIFLNLQYCHGHCVMVFVFDIVERKLLRCKGYFDIYASKRWVKNAKSAKDKIRVSRIVFFVSSLLYLYLWELIKLIILLLWLRCQCFELVKLCIQEKKLPFLV